MEWRTIRIRADLHRLVNAQAQLEGRSVASMADRLLTGALEQETGRRTTEGASGDASPSPARASGEEPAGGTDARTASHRPSPHSIPGQATVDEMLASCPNCAGNFVQWEDGRMTCEDCGTVRENG